MTNALPASGNGTSSASVWTVSQSNSPLPDDPGQETMPVAQPVPAALNGSPVTYNADRQTWSNKTVTLFGVEEFRYRDYVLRADKVVYNEETTEVEAEGNLRLSGGPDDIVLNASHGDLRLNTHTARFYDVSGMVGVRSAGRTVVYSTPNPFQFKARVLLQTGEQSYRIVDGSMTNCRLPRPDWQLFSRSIDVTNGRASTSNVYFRLLGVPLFYIPYLRHPVESTGRESGFLIPVLSVGSSVRGYTFGEQVYLVINRSMDMIVGSEYYSKRGFAPNGDFRYKGPGLDHLTARWNSLLDRGIEQLQTSGPQTGQTILINQGGVDIVALGRKDFTGETHIAGNVEYLSSYIYRLVFNDNYWQAISSQVHSDISLTHNHEGFIPSADLSRLQTFASSSEGNEVRILHLPSVRFDVLDRPLGDSLLYWGLGSSGGDLGRAEPGFHAHNSGRLDLYPHISAPFQIGGWSFVPEGALRDTFYTTSQYPNLSGLNGGVPTVRHDALNRTDAEASLSLRPPAMERDFTLGNLDRVLRHVIEPELTYRYAGGIGPKAQNVLIIDTDDIATDTNEIGASITQRFYLKPLHPGPCQDGADAAGETAGTRCGSTPREWASWQIAEKYFLDPNFGGAIVPNRRNVFDSTLDLTGIAFVTGPRNLSPIISRLRFEAIDNLRIQWDLDFDPKTGRLGADNVFAGYSRGATTVGIGHSMLNAVDEQGSVATIIKSQQIEPFLQIGKQTGRGFNLAANGGYDFVRNSIQYAGVQAVYNWNCCGLTAGYRRYSLGNLRDETQYLYGFTLASFGSVGDIRRSNNVFRDPALPPAY